MATSLSETDAALQPYPPLSEVMRRSLLAFFCLAAPSAALTAAENAETVILLHGLGRGAASMAPIERVLTREGYRVINLGYDSRNVPLETLARDWLPAQLRARGADTAPRLHFVTHSMGGIVLRLYLRERPTGSVPLGRTVMIAPPNQGSEVSAHLKNFAPFRWFTGVNGARLDPAPTSLPRSLDPWPANAGELGIIAGDRSFNPLFSSWLPGPNDGKVSVASTHLSGETAHLVLHHTHTWLPARAETATFISTFLRTGSFLPSHP